MDKLVTAFYVAVYLIVTYGRKALIILTAFLSVVFMLAMIIAICRYYDCKYAEERK